MLSKARIQLGEALNDVYGGVQPASYTPHFHPQLRGNPFAEALPPVLDREPWLRRFVDRADYEPDVRTAPPEQRHMLAGTTPYFLQPLARHYYLAQALTNNLHMGYAYRNPLDPSYVRSVNHLAGHATSSTTHPMQTRPKGLGSGTAANALLLTGASGMGKTTSVRRILGQVPPAVVHSEYDGQPLTTYQLIHLYVEMPSSGTTKALSTAVFDAVDSTLGTDLRNLYLRRRMAKGDLAEEMAGVLGHLGLGLLVIDEIQNLDVGHSGGNIQTLNFLTYLTNQLNVPILLIGTSAAESFIFKQFRLIRRTTGQGVTEWSHLTGSEFQLFLQALWRYQYTASPTELTQDLIDAMYEESQGNIDVAIKVYRLAQQRAIEIRDRAGHKDEKLSPRLIRTVARGKLGAVAELMRLVRERNSRGLGQYGDLKLPPLTKPDMSSTKEAEISKDDLEGSHGGEKMDRDPSFEAEVKAGTGTIQETNFLLELARRSPEDRLNSYETLKDEGLILPLPEWLQATLDTE